MSVAILMDAGGELFQKVAGFNFKAPTDAIWIRFPSADDMYRLADSVLQLPDSTEAFLLAEILPDGVNPKLREFQGAFGRAKLLGMNKKKTFSRKLYGLSESFYIDGAPVSVGDERKRYLTAVFNLSAGFLLHVEGPTNTVVECALKHSEFPAFLLHLIDHATFVGVFVENDMGARSIVILGHPPIIGIPFSVRWCEHETAKAISETILAYGDRLSNRHVFERALSAPPATHPTDRF